MQQLQSSNLMTFYTQMLVYDRDAVHPWRIKCLAFIHKKWEGHLSKMPYLALTRSPVLITCICEQIYFWAERKNLLNWPSVGGLSRWWVLSAITIQRLNSGFQLKCILMFKLKHSATKSMLVLFRHSQACQYEFVVHVTANQIHTNGFQYVVFICFMKSFYKSYSCVLSPGGSVKKKNMVQLAAFCLCLSCSRSFSFAPAIWITVVFSCLHWIEEC